MAGTSLLQRGGRSGPPGMPLPAIRRKVPHVVGLTQARQLKQMCLGLVSAASLLAAAGLWGLPGSAADPDAALIKSGLTAVLLVLGLSMLRAVQAGPRPEACFDPVRRELRILLRGAAGQPHTVLRRSYDTIGSARLGPRRAELYEPDGRLILQLPLADAKSRQLLRAHLLGMVPITS